MPCQEGRKRPRAACSAGSTSRRSVASVARRMRRRTSGSHHSRSVPPGGARRGRAGPPPRAAAAPAQRLPLEGEPRGGLARGERAVRLRKAREDGRERVGRRARGTRRAAHPAERCRTRRGRGPRPRPRAGTRLPPSRTRIARRSRTSVSAKPGSASPATQMRRSGAGGRAARRRCAASARSDASTLLDRAGVEQVAELLDAHAARAGGRGRARAPARGARPAACRPRTCRSRRSRRAATRRTARRTAVSTSTRSSSRGLDAAQDPAERREVEDVLEALAVRLEHDRELRVAPGDLEQVLRLQPLLPQRRALAGPPARDEQGAASVLAEARAEERRLRELPERRGPRARRGRASRSGTGGGTSASGKWSAMPSSDQSDWASMPEVVAQPRAEGHRPGRVHTTAERREHAHAPVADLVAEALDDDRAVRRDHARRTLLVAQERDEVRGSPPLEVVVGLQPVARRVVRERDELARGAPDPLSELERPPDALALPERGDRRACPERATRARGRG